MCFIDLAEYMSDAENILNEILHWFDLLLSFPGIFGFSWANSKYMKIRTDYWERIRVNLWKLNFCASVDGVLEFVYYLTRNI